jgi:hypothetical protein
MHGFCAVCHGSADGQWADITGGFDIRQLSPSQLEGIRIAYGTSERLSPYAEGGVKIVGSAFEAVGAVALAPVSGGSSLGLMCSPTRAAIRRCRRRMHPI